jgi:nitroreductase
MKDCPMAIMVAGDESVTDLWVDNCSISATILQLAVTDAGLGSCWVHINGRPKLKAEPEGKSAEEYLREFLPIPAEWRPLCFIALGYPAQEVKPHSEKDDSDKVIWVK